MLLHVKLETPFLALQADQSILTRISDISRSVDSAHSQLMQDHACAGDSLLEDPINDMQDKVYAAVNILAKGLLERETEVRRQQRAVCEDCSGYDGCSSIAAVAARFSRRCS